MEKRGKNAYAAPPQGDSGAQVAGGGAPPQGDAPTQAAGGARGDSGAPPQGDAPTQAAGGGAQDAPAPERRSKRASFWRVVFWLAVAVFVCSLIALGVILFSYQQGRVLYSDLAADAVDVGAADDDAADLGDLTVDWDALLAINPDTIGWIYIPGTAVNYPVVYSGDDSRYLHTDFYGNETWPVSYGTIFLSGINEPDLSDANNILYGHHMNDGSMFAALADLAASDEAFNAHRTAYFLTPEGSIRLTSFALVHVPGTSGIAQATFASSEDQTAYVQARMDESIVSAAGDVPAAEDIEQTFMLSTCDEYSSGRYVLFCYVEESSHPNVRAVASAAGDTESAIVDAEDAAAIEEAQRAQHGQGGS